VFRRGVGPGGLRPERQRRSDCGFALDNTKRGWHRDDELHRRSWSTLSFGGGDQSGVKQLADPRRKCDQCAGRRVLEVYRFAVDEFPAAVLSIGLALNLSHCRTNKTGEAPEPQSSGPPSSVARGSDASTSTIRDIPAEHPASPLRTLREFVPRAFLPL